MTTVDVDTTIDELAGFDNDERPPCAAKDCKVPATWRATVLCPIRRHTWTLCDLHHQREVDLLAMPGPNVCVIHRESPLPAPYLKWRHL